MAKLLNVWDWNEWKDLPDNLKGHVLSCEDCRMEEDRRVSLCHTIRLQESRRIKAEILKEQTEG